jgi:hypothetical protein
MAIAFDNAASLGVASGTKTSLTASFTCSGDNRLLIVGTQTQSGGANVSKITYNGVNLTLLDTYSYASLYEMKIWYLIAPASGANDIVISKNNGNIWAGAISYTGVKQTDFPDSNARATDYVVSDTSYTLTTTTVADNSWAVAFGYVYQTPSATSPATLRATRTNQWFLSDSGPFTPAGSSSISMTCSPTGEWSTGIIVSFAPSIAAGPANLKSVNGLAKASIKSIKGLAIGSVKKYNGLA